MTDRRQAFLELVRANRARLRKICRVYATDPEDRRDLSQEILMEAWRSLDSFDGAATPETWFYRVALNTALDRDRKRKVRAEARLDPGAPVLGAEVPDPEEAAARRHRAERLHAAIDRLDEADRALALMHLDERPYAEMAEVLGITENYVGVRLHRIRKKLADWLEDER